MGRNLLNATISAKKVIVLLKSKKTASNIIKKLYIGNMESRVNLHQRLITHQHATIMRRSAHLH